MMAQPKILLLLMALLIVNPFYGQSDQAKIDKATNLVKAYIDASYFNNGINTGSLEYFKTLFDPSAKIVFDIPFINTAIKNDDIKRISKDDRQQPDFINVFGKLVAVDMYVEILDREAEKFQLNDLDCIIKLADKIDLTRIKSDTIIFEIEKQFDSTFWSVKSKVKYLVCIGFSKNEAQILTIYNNSENTSQADIQVKLVDGSLKSKDEPGYILSDVDVRLTVTFKEPINNFAVSGTTNSGGLARFDRVASNSSVVYLDTVTNKNGIRYDIPPDWKIDGKKVGEQPAGGFVIGLRPYKWNGMAYSLFFSGGGTVPAKMDLDNFKDGSGFESKVGSKFGLNLNLTYFFRHDQWKINPRKWLIGLGSGFSMDYQKSSFTGSEFQQQPYNYIDNLDDNCQVMYKGRDFSEDDDMISVSVPLFVEFKKQAGTSFSFSVKAGVNLSLPVSGNFEAVGTFSRWGYYDDLNSLPITDDGIYNYFTDSVISYAGNIEYGSVLGEGFVKLNGYFNVFKKNPDNSLEVGLIFSMPFTGSTVYNYPEGGLQDYEGYWINTGDDEYHSLAYSTGKIYQYYIGISVGVNLIWYRSR